MLSAKMKQLFQRSASGRDEIGKKTHKRTRLLLSKEMDNGGHRIQLKASSQPVKHTITIQARTPIYTQQNRLREEVASENLSRT